MQTEGNVTRHARRGAVVLGGVLLASAAVAGTTVYRCNEGGRVVFSDSPCGGPASAPQASGAVVAGGGNYGTLFGEWRGQAQFQASESGRQVAAGHAVAPLVLNVAPDSKVTGVSSDSGCKLLGLASPGFLPTVMNLDVTLSGCQYAPMNRRLTGTLALNTSAKVVQLSVQAYSVPTLGPTSRYEVTATLRR